MKILIGSDHRGFELKKNIIENIGYPLIDIGCDSPNRCDYPDIVKKLVQQDFDFGILICNTGIGMSICANKYEKIRAGLCMSLEMAKLSREHNDCNILVIPAAYIKMEIAIGMINVFTENSFSSEEIYESRLRKFPNLLNF